MTHRPLSDEELHSRTQSLIRAAESISLELMLQTERLSATIDIFNREVVEPLREITDKKSRGGHHD